jgi:hypothetical protein
MRSMKRAAHYLLTLTFAALLALPPGWCCFVNANALRPARIEEKVAADCCCCPAHKSKPDQPAPADDVTPTRPPVAFCCCEPTPAAIKKAERDQPADEALAFPPAPAPAPALRAAAPDGYDPAPPPKRPLHLLRCVWLC